MGFDESQEDFARGMPQLYKCLLSGIDESQQDFARGMRQLYTCLLKLFNKIQ